jgi:DNA-binding transcriptional MerR regulator
MFFLDMVARLAEVPVRMGKVEHTAEAAEPTYSLGAVVRLTGLSPHLLRAWERRYGAVSPQRTEGGTRRYRESEVARLRLLHAAVQAGHRIGDVANLDDPELRRLLELERTQPSPPLSEIREATRRLDLDAVERLVGRQLAGLGPRDFAKQVVEPLMRELGERWEQGECCVASEHLLSAVARSYLGAMLLRASSSAHSPPILLTTPPGERHELGLLMSAVAAADAGGNPVYLGPELPLEELTEAVANLNAGAVALSISRMPRREGEHAVRSIRKALPPDVELWVGGAASHELSLPPRTERVDDFEELERKVELLGARRSRPTARRRRSRAERSRRAPR